MRNTTSAVVRFGEMIRRGRLSWLPANRGDRPERARRGMLNRI